MALICVICHEDINVKYKCSTCFSPYCSVNCWKRHKCEGNCKPKEQPQTKINSHINSAKEKYFTEDTVSDEKLKQLGESETIKNILRDKYLRNTLIAVDNALNPEESLCLAMKDPEFVKLVDECLKIVEDNDD